MDKGKILVIVAARGGSKGVKDKNIRPLCGHPLIAHTIKQVKRWGKADRFICSTDSEKIAGIARKYGLETPFMRPPELATDNAGKLQVIQHAVNFIEGRDNERYEIIIDLDATAPLRKIDDIEGALSLFLDKRPKTVFSVSPCRRNPYFNMVELNKDGYAVTSKDAGLLVRRQDAPPVFDVNASIYIYDRDYLMGKDTKKVISDRSLVWVMDEFSAFDIDTEADFQFIEFLIKKGLVAI